jgi:hypothetical protein
MTAEKNREFVDGTYIFKFPGRKALYIWVKVIALFILCSKRSSV